ncbi:S1-like domain-containing RNA-binding protein [Marivirga atlantica]|uniref:GntR family transcriptional regulator n=1 Tax=Marivirga atlantica TaxID=1548457 RepID=A0A937A8X4_9BACT|nr:S1-like domain-containing RNA-binding protein [Marivirga atlantica]MBL0765775.1 GntR family transcriptional regulator [Marivirga atlantica]
MLKIGEWNSLEVKREAPQGLYLGDADEDVLLPNKYIKEGTEIGKEVDVFIYKDSAQRPIATTLKPYAEINQIGFFEVKQITEVGAFVDWGLEKDLLIPFSEQSDELEVGDWIVAYVVLDPQTERIIATMHVDSFLQLADEAIQEGQDVELIIYRITDLGYQVAINQHYKGLVYEDTVFEYLDIGMESKGKIKSIRADGKIDVQWIVPNEKKDFIIEMLENENGFLPYHDKSDPQTIKETFGLSKREFKKHIGNLFRDRKITIKPDGIYLNQNEPNP